MVKQEKVIVKIADEKIEETTKNSKTSAAEIASRIVFAVFVLFIYLALMGITGGTVYATYGWRGRGSNGTFIDSVVGMTQVAGETFFPGTQLFNKTNTTTVIPTTTPCPLVGTCPPIVGCIERNDTCIAQPQPPCIPPPVKFREPCLEMLPCRNGTCRAPDCPTPKPELPIEVFRTAQLDTKPVYEWLNFYPTYSSNRLEVVTTLMDELIENWVTEGFFHRCTGNPEYPRDTTTCTFCQDRYDYIKCIMSNNIIGPLNPTTPIDQLTAAYISPAKFLVARQDLAITVMDNKTPARTLDYIFDYIERAIKVFAVRTESGGECRVCKDFWRGVLNPCFSDEKQWYTM